MSSNSNNNKSVVFAFLSGAAVGSIAWAYMTRTKKIDPATKAQQHLWKIAEYSLTGGLIRVGDKIQLYDALWNSGPSTAAELAAKMKCSERWLTEILCQATAAGICVYFFGKFCLKPEYAHLLRDPKQAPNSMQGLFDIIPALLDRTDATVESIKSGIGCDYDYQDGILNLAIDRKNYNWFQYKLEDEVLKHVQVPNKKDADQNLVQLLEAGIQVADIGCGFGASTIAMAKRFPKSTFCAFETSQKALLKIQERIDAAKLTNVTVYNAFQRSLADGPAAATSGAKTFDLIYVHDVIHDMCDPKAFLKEAKKALTPNGDGCLVIVDMKSSESLKENIAKPDGALKFGFSCFCCLACSTCKTKKGGIGAGLGTCGFPETMARRWTKELGFNHFETIEIQSLPGNSCFIVA